MNKRKNTFKLSQVAALFVSISFFSAPTFGADSADIKTLSAPAVSSSVDIHDKKSVVVQGEHDEHDEHDENHEHDESCGHEKLSEEDKAYFERSKVKNRNFNFGTSIDIKTPKHLMLENSPDDSNKIVVESPPCELPAASESAAGIFQRTASCLEDKKMDKAVLLYFIGQIRLRTLAVIDKNPEGANSLLSSVTYAFGPPVNGWAGGDIPSWIETLSDSLDWDKRNPFLELDYVARKNFRPLTEAYAVREEVRRGISMLINNLTQDISSIYLKRDKSGFTVRDPWWTEDVRGRASLSDSNILIPVKRKAQELKDLTRENFENGNLIYMK